MDALPVVLCLLGAVLGFGLGYAFVKAKLGPELGQAQAQKEEGERAKAELATERTRLEQLIGENRSLQSQIESEKKASEDQRRLLEEAQTNLSDAFKALSSDALRKNSTQFLELAQSALKTYNEQAKGDLEKRQQAIGELVKPIEEKLKSFDENIKSIEKERVGAYEQLKEQVKGLSESQTRLQAETNNLVRALRNPQQRGQWGEMQLETILKHAGLQEGVHYNKQVSVTGEDGGGRPDFVVLFPNGMQIVIDSKAPLDAYLDAQECTDEDTRIAKFKDHAKHVRNHAQSLGRRAYQDRFESCDFVVMFLPAESLYSVAIQHDPRLLEFGAENKVFIASPVTLITMLRSVAMGWRHEQLAKNAKQISDEAKELYARFGVLGKHFAKLGDRLDGAVAAYNDSVGSLETRVLPQARKLKELHATTAEDIPALETVERTSRELQSPELRVLPSALVLDDEPVILESATVDRPEEAESGGGVTLAAAMVED